jgi:NitT/TauT family transport system permease protein
VVSVLITIPKELQEASAAFGLSSWSRLTTLELPFAAIGLVWNSMMSWAGGWFFLMAAEIFTVGNRDFRLPGLGAYLHEAATRGNITAIAWGVGMLVFMIGALDQLLWRPLLAWSDRFKIESVEGEARPTSWFYDVLILSPLVNRLREGPLKIVNERLDAACERGTIDPGTKTSRVLTVATYAAMAVVAAGLLDGAFRAVAMLSNVPVAQCVEILRGGSATFLRVVAALALALAWTIPAGVAIGANRRLAQWCQPFVQVAASVPATALFPVVLLVVLQRPGG